MKTIALTLLFILTTLPDSETFYSPLDGIEWENISELVVKEKVNLIEATELRADRIILKADLYTEGKPLIITARELIFEGGAIRGFEKEKQGIPPTKPAPDKAKNGLDCPGDLIETHYYLVKGNVNSIKKEDNTAIRVTEARAQEVLKYLQPFGFMISKFWTNGMRMDLGGLNGHAGVHTGIASFNLMNLGHILSKEDYQSIRDRSQAIQKRLHSANFKDPLTDKERILSNGANYIEAQAYWEIVRDRALPPEIQTDYFFDIHKEIGIQSRYVVVETAAERIKGKPGTNGAQGLPGFDGEENPGSIKITAEIVRGHALVDGSGQKGGKGGMGQPGGAGGDGGKGCNADSGLFGSGIGSSDNSPGGRGGDGGHAGEPGVGGKGGAPIHVTIHFDRAAKDRDLENLTAEKIQESWKIISQAGVGGEAGDGGKGGDGGLGGIAGSTDQAWFNKVGEEMPRAESGTSRPDWTGDVEIFRGMRDTALKLLAYTPTVASSLEKKNSVMDALFELQFERSRWTLFLKSIDFGIRMVESDPLATRAAIADSQQDPLLLAAQEERKQIALAWQRYLRVVRFEKTQLEKTNDIKKDDSLKRFLADSERIGTIFESLASVEDGTKVSSKMMESLTDLTDYLESRMLDMADILADRCQKYMAEPLSQELAIFRIQFCYDQSWRENPMHVFNVFEPLDPLVPEISALSLTRTALNRDDFIPKRFRDIFKISRAVNLTSSIYAGDDSIQALLGDEAFRSLLQSVKGMHSYYSESSIRKTAAIRSLKAVSYSDIKNKEALEAALVVMGLQRVVFAGEQTK